MRRSFNKLGKAATLFAATSLLMATTSVIPADAANKAGARCTKANAKTKIGGDQYLCTKNPTVKNAKLTWVWIGCVDAHNEYLASVAAQKEAKVKLDAAITMFDLDIQTLNSKRSEYVERALQLEKDAAAWKAKAVDAAAKAKVLKDSLVSRGFNKVIDKSHLDLLRTVIKPPVDTTLSAADTTLLTTRWNTTADQLKLWFDAIQEFSLRDQSENFLLGEKNALRSAESVRNEISKQIAKKEESKKKEIDRVTQLGSQIKTQLSARKTSCRPGL